MPLECNPGNTEAADLLAEDFVGLAVDHLVNDSFVFEGDKAEAAMLPGVAVHHERAVGEHAKLAKVVEQHGLGDAGWDVAHKEFVRRLFFTSWDGALWVNLAGQQARLVSVSLALVCVGHFESTRKKTYSLAVEEVLSDHDIVDCSRIFEGQEGKAARSTRTWVSHDGAGDDLAELAEVVRKTLWKKGRE